MKTSGKCSLSLDSVIRLLSNRKSFSGCGKSLWQALAVILFVYWPSKGRNSSFLVIEGAYMDTEEKSARVSELVERNTSHSSVSTNERLGCAHFMIPCCRRQSPSLGLYQKAEKPGVKFCLLTRYS